MLSTKTSTTDRSRWQPALLACVLAALVVVVFLQTRHFVFLDYDDGPIVTENPQVQRGLNIETLRWAFTSFHFGLYMPLTSLTHLLDVSLYGDWAGGHHLTSVFLHAVNSVLLFLALRALTGSVWRSFFVAALFAAHPLRIESVAWVASRKDLVSGGFVMLCLMAYAGYARRPEPWRYLLVLLTYTAALLGKPTALPLPLVLLLLDWWPLGRLRDVPDPPAPAPRLLRLFFEKIPLFTVGAVIAIVTVIAENSLETLPGLEHYPAHWRVQNALLSYARYLAHLFYPAGLAIHYPQIIAQVPGWQVLSSALLLVLLTLLACVGWRQRYLITGWLWYLLMLAPVIGLVQFGSAAMADRFMYLPQIGLNLALVWGVSALASGRPVLLRAAGLAGAAVIVILAALAWRETGFWRDTRTVFTRALAVTGENALAWSKLGDLAFDEGRPEEAHDCFARALVLEPRNGEHHYNYGSALLELGRPQDAAQALEMALRLRPEDVEARVNLGIALLHLNRQEQALGHLGEAVAQAPDHVNGRINYGVALLRVGRRAEAREQFEAALRLEPGNEAARANLALVE